MRAFAGFAGFAGLGLVAVAVIGCYRPSTQADIPCSSDGTCPGGQVCDSSRAPPVCVSTLADAGGGSESPTIDAQTCFDAPDVGLHVCLQVAPMGALSLGSAATSVVDTNNAGSCTPLQAGSTDACVLAGDTVTIDAAATIAATGDKPLVIVAAASITVAGTIDVASHANGPRLGAVGPMANFASCDTGGTVDDRGGGAGGSFGSEGGDGGDEAGVMDSGGGSGGVLALGLHGGCAGQLGGNDGGVPGAGGGAVVLIASTIGIANTGVIDASGAAGGGAGTNGQTRGGGGGGSGGLIVFQTSALDGTAGAKIFANGGGGGGASNAQIVGSIGDDPADPATPASGGDSGGQAGPGGDGFCSTAIAEDGDDGGNGTDGGGGGGGGAGIIHVSTGATISGSPTLSPPPS